MAAPYGPPLYDARTRADRAVDRLTDAVLALNVGRQHHAAASPLANATLGRLAMEAREAAIEAELAYADACKAGFDPLVAA